MDIQFSKMHGLGNDFVVIDGIHQSIDPKKLPIPQLANRHLGIGFDQLLLIESATNADFFVRIFNSDGTEAEQCGNGLRCVARFIYEQKLSDQSELTLATRGGRSKAIVKDYNNIEVTMGIPQLNPEEIPFKVEKIATLYDLSLTEDTSTQAAVLGMGNPHVIVRVQSLTDAPVLQVGNRLASHPQLPHGANVGFMEILAPDHVRLRTFERGAGETHACGSNACAAVVAGIINHWLDHKVKVEFRYGSLQIAWAGPAEPVIMTGPAFQCFTGTVTV